MATPRLSVISPFLAITKLCRLTSHSQSVAGGTVAGGFSLAETLATCCSSHSCSIVARAYFIAGARYAAMQPISCYDAVNRLQPVLGHFLWWCAACGEPDYVLMAYGTVTYSFTGQSPGLVAHKALPARTILVLLIGRALWAPLTLPCIVSCCAAMVRLHRFTGWRNACRSLRTASSLPQCSLAVPRALVQVFSFCNHSL